jgi:WhiB family redox-sensing transcriptional regulator
MTARSATVRELLRAVEQGDAWWGVLAACQDEDPELFFPEPGQRPAAAKRICASCPVRPQCLQFALSVGSREDDYGVFGGTSEWERRKQRAGAARRSPLGSDRERVVAAFELATSVGINEAAARLDLSPKTLREAFDRWELGRPPVPQPMRRQEAEQAFALAEEIGLREAARRLDRSPAALYRAFDRWGLGRPDSSKSAARWQRQLSSGDRQRVLREVIRRDMASGRARRRRAVRAALDLRETPALVTALGGEVA